MKKKILMLLSASLGAILAVLVSCAKEEKAGSMVKSARDNLIPQTEEEIEQRIRDFQYQCDLIKKNPGLKNFTLLTYDDALWLMEASINYKYGNPDKKYQYSRVDSCFISIPGYSGDSVAFQDVAESFDRLSDSLSSIYFSTTWSEKHILITDLSVCDTASAESHTVKMSVVIGKDYNDSVPFTNPFNETDYWFWGGMQGKCGPYYPCCYGSDASLQMSLYQSWFRPFEQIPSGHHAYFTDIEEINVNGNDYPNENDLVPHDNLRDYYLFFNDPALPNFHQCIEPGEMWFYFQGLFKIVNDPDKASSLTTPPYKSFVSLSLLTIQDNNFRIFHRAKIKYGIRHFSGDPCYPIPIVTDN